MSSSDLGTSYSLSEILLSYVPINYEKTLKFGPGNYIREKLSAAQQATWDACLELQDKRNDPGQGEIVTYFALSLSRILNLSQADSDIAICAAILHDVGYSFIENILEISARHEKAYWSGESQSNQLLKEENTKIRLLHQKLAVQHAKTLLHDHKRLNEICEIISEHDTRENPPSTLGRIMWDADILWRITVPSVEASNRRSDEVELARLIEKKEEQLILSHKQLHLPLSLTLGKLEFANSMLHLSKVKSEALPQKFLQSYKSEIEFLTAS